MNQSKAAHYHLAGDIGGTKTSLGLYDDRQGPLSPVAEITVQNDTAAGFEEVVSAFLGQADIRPVSACFGIAGPVIDNRVRMTNLDWIIDGRKLQQTFGIDSVALINDLVATAMGATVLPEERLLTLNRGNPVSGAAVAVIAPGTGLGEAFLVNHQGRLLPNPSEGGHSSFAPVNDMQQKLLRYMTARQGHVSFEQVCSGLGIPHLYDFMLEEYRQRGDIDSILPLPDNPEPTIAIIEAALETRNNDGKNLAAADALELFIDILASESANLVLKVLGTGGLYIGGGLPPRILPFLSEDSFMKSFCKGIYREMLAEVPVRVILEPETALIGAAAYAFGCHLHNGEKA